MYRGIKLRMTGDCLLEKGKPGDSDRKEKETLSTCKKSKDKDFKMHNNRKNQQHTSRARKVKGSKYMGQLKYFFPDLKV